MTSVKKKRVSKKLKSSWRKNVNIDDVEEFLEDQRLEERLGPSLSTLPNNELFKLDNAPEEHISTKERRKLRANKPLKCFGALQPHTKVPDPIKKRNRVRSKEERKNDLIKKKELANRIKGILKPKQVQAIQSRKLDQIRRSMRHKKDEFNADIWAADSKQEVENIQWIEKNTSKHILKNSGVPQKRVREHVKERKSVNVPIEPPHPGMSYNPSFEDHQDLLKQIADKESAWIKKDDYLTRVTRGMFHKVTANVRDSNWLVEMSEGLPSQEGTNLDENEHSDNEYKAINPPVKNAKKTVKQRRKQKEQQELALKRKQTKLEKKKVTDIHRIKVLKKDISKSEKKQGVIREKREKRVSYKKKEANRLSSTKFEEPDLDFNLGEDITGNLRNLKKEGSLLTDRFKSLQKRNILEPSVKRHRKNAKVKKYTKPGHKEDWKKSVCRA